MLERGRERRIALPDVTMGSALRSVIAGLALSADSSLIRGDCFTKHFARERRLKEKDEEKRRENEADILHVRSSFCMARRASPGA